MRLGERVTPVSGLAGLPAILVNPGIKLSTADIFRTLKAKPLQPEKAGPPPSFPGWQSPEEAAAWLKEGRNDLEAPAIALEPAVERVLDTLRRLDGCLLTRLSGSGPTCFGIFLSNAAAARAAREIERSYPAWWVQATTFVSVAMARRLSGARGLTSGLRAFVPRMSSLAWKRYGHESGVSIE